MAGDEGGRPPLFIVGVGASAGGLEALERLFGAVQPTGRLAFVVIQHLSPDFKSLMDELLSRHTSLAIRRAESGMVVEADTLYLLPPRKEMIIAGGQLVLRDREPDQGLFVPIDVFFASLATDAGSRAVGVVLSGTGSDGSRGLRAIHEAGGLVVAQTEESAKFDGMPRAALETGLVDLVLPPEAIGAALARFAERGGDLPGEDREAAGPGLDALDRVFDLLRRESGVDFSGYKLTTVGRRIERRLLMSDTRQLEDYAARLERDPAELRSLYRDLLIGVTRFFRDPEAFERLRGEVLPGLVDRLSGGEELRLWVPACATGEEAYSIAMAVHEAFRSRGRPVALKLFATDIHRPSLEVAGAGLYGAEAVASVPEELRQRYFVATAEGHHVSSELRAGIVFAHHNLLRDAPFTRLDLVSCRNMLIYLRPVAQRRVISLFHFGLKASGVLFLGPSETPGPLAEEFATVDARWRVYRKRRDVRLAADVPLRAVPELRGGRNRAPEEEPRVRAARDALLARYAPPTLVVDDRFELLHAFNGAGRYLAQRDGRPSLNLLDLVGGDLRFVVTAALKRAQKEREPVTYAGVSWRDGNGVERLTVRVELATAGTRPDEVMLLTLEPEAPAPAAALASLPDPDARERDRVQGLEAELRSTRENLQATVEEMETSNEELQATNEELIASNEELQSTNEELHSVNEELYTVNAEYQSKIAELTELTADMNHLLEATQVHTLFLDRDLRLRKFTPRMAELFNLLPQDLGRPIEGFAHGFDHQGLLDDLRRVLAAGAAAEREVTDPAGRAFLLRVLPYRPAQEIQGVVVTLVDVAQLKEAQRELAGHLERRDKLLAMLSHELRTPLGAILNAAELMEWGESGSARQALEIVRRQSQHMARMLDDLLDAARLTHGRLAVDRRTLELGAVVRQAASAIGLEIERRGLALDLSLPDGPLHVVGDAVRLQQVVANLLANAARYTPSGRISVSLQADGGEATLRVADTGIGMTPEELQRAFDLFYQAPQPIERPAGGLGVGLSLARSLVELHGGRVTARSEGRGLGSELTVTLPLVKSGPVAEPPAPQREAPLRRLKVALVEDNEDIRDVTRELLELAGHEVVVAGDGHAGLALLLGERPDVAFVDIGLPGLSGYEVARQVRQAVDGTLKLVALTGYGRAEDLAASREAGFDAHLVKPIESRRLAQLIRSLTPRE